MIAESHPSFIVPAVVSLVAGGVWLWLIGPAWVQLAAERYADRLLGASVTLPARPHRKEGN